MLRRLDPVSDRELLREAFAWTADTPSWHRDMDSVFGPETADEFLEMAAETILVGIFDSSIIGLIIIAPAGKDVFNSHLCAKRDAPLNMLAASAAQVMNDFLGLGMKEGFCWVAEKNRSVRSLCDTIGFQHEGVVMYKGVYKNRLIKWLRYSVRPEVKQVEIAA